MSSCNCGRCIGCKIIGGITALLLIVVAIAAAMGVSNSHLSADGGWIFGTQQGSIAIIAFVASLVALWKVTRKMCPCNSRGCGMGAGCGCGSSCDCGGKCGCAGGGCPCGKDNCDCGAKCGCGKPGCPACSKKEGMPMGGKHKM